MRASVPQPAGEKNALEADRTQHRRCFQEVRGYSHTLDKMNQLQNTIMISALLYKLLIYNVFFKSKCLNIGDAMNAHDVRTQH